MTGSGRQATRPLTASGGSTQDPRVLDLGSTGAYIGRHQRPRAQTEPRAPVQPRNRDPARPPHTDLSGWGRAPVGHRGRRHAADCDPPADPATCRPERDAHAPQLECARDQPLAAIVGRARTTLHGLPRLPTAVVRALSVHGDVLRLSVRIPALVAGQSSVTLSALASRHGRVAARGVATAADAAAARTVTVTLALNHAPGTGARVRVSVVTLNGGTTPSRTVSTFTRS